MKPNEPIVDSYYVREEKSLILHFYSAGSDGQAWYHAYNLQDGKYRYTSGCWLGTMMQWADRKATVEEIGLLHRESPPEVDTQSGGVFERRGSALRRALRSSSRSRFDY